MQQELSSLSSYLEDLAAIDEPIAAIIWPFLKNERPLAYRDKIVQETVVSSICNRYGAEDRELAAFTGCGYSARAVALATVLARKRLGGGSKRTFMRCTQRFE